MWKKVACPRSELELLFTLCGGQCFRWRKTGSGEWTGVFFKRVWILSQDDENILYRVITNFDSPRSGESDSELLRKYFRLDVTLEDHYAQWSKKDPHFKEAADKFKGVRILAQDPVENVFSFICSSNNNISRISSLVEKLCLLYGDKIAEVDGIVYHEFPPVEALADPSVEKTLREASFGYRARFIQQSACKIMEMGGSDWLTDLKCLPYDQAKVELMKLPGIGAKVADCICLMSLCHLEAVPVDTHMYQVAAHKYLPHLKGRKTVTDKMYAEIGDHFRSLYGPMAGWAQTILFCADLKMFQDISAKKRKRK